MRLKMLPYKMGSASAKALAQALHIKRIIPGGRYKPTQYTKVINWGTSRPHTALPNVLNQPSAVAKAANKLTTFQVLSQAGISIPQFTTNHSVAEDWLEEGYRLVLRHKLSSHSGQGIQIVQDEDTLPYAPLYVKYQKKDVEYRVHVFNGKVIDCVQKRRRSGITEGSPYIRTLSNGWVFCRDGVTCPNFVLDECLRATKALGLDFAAIDVIVKNNKVYILEANTAPGLEGTTLRKYVEAFSNYA